MASQLKRLPTLILVGVAIWWAYRSGEYSARNEALQQDIEQERAFYALVLKSDPAFSQVSERKIKLPNRRWFLDGMVESESDLEKLRNTLQPYLTPDGAEYVTSNVRVKSKSN